MYSCISETVNFVIIDNFNCLIIFSIKNIDFINIFVVYIYLSLQKLMALPLKVEELTIRINFKCIMMSLCLVIVCWINYILIKASHSGLFYNYGNISNNGLK